MKIKSMIYTVLLAGLLFSLLFSCKKDAIKVIPTVTIATVTNITATTATSGGVITSDGGATVTSRGVCWSASQSPTTADSKTSNSTGTGSFTSSLTGLTPGETYYLKAYAINSVGTAYSSQATCTTLALAPVLTTTDLSNITSTSASSGGNITNDGGAAVTARGVCWSTSQNPTTADSKTSDGTGTGSFTSAITGLTPGATYYVRAYATNNIGTGYGNQVTAAATAILPALTTTAVSAFTSTTATSGGNITSDGGSAVMTRGVCWGTSASPTIASSKTTDASGSGIFTSSITGLTPSTTYYIRAYATNGIGTAYGNEVTTTTTAALPTLSTVAASTIWTTTATSGGNITSDGGAAVMARGVCWSTSTTPTITDSKTTDGTGTGSFTSSLTGLTPGATLYYIRAYATNSIGTAYGNQLTFSTMMTAPVLTTTAVSAITATTATSGGNVTSNGGGAQQIYERGVCWSTSPNPTIANTKTSDGNGLGSFTSYLSGLTANTTYYYRAWAINSQAGYGNELSFTTSSGLTVTDIDGNVYSTVTIGTQVWMAENLKTTKYRNGNAIPNVTNASTWAGLSTGAYCDYNNTPSNSTTYGKLYNGYAVIDSRNIAPTGWHVPTDAEWTILTTYLGGESVAGGKLKETGTNHWLGPNTGATNETGFTALPGGTCRWDGSFFVLNYTGHWWSSTADWFRDISYYYSIVERFSNSMVYGFSVRCVKD